MLDLETRTAILRLHRAGHGSKRIAKALGVSRNAVRRVLRSGEAAVPPLDRSSRLAPHLDRVRGLHATCNGNLVRVHEELVAQGIEVGYATLTRFCRRYHIGHAPPQAAGTYDFAPGVEMQHDTSPHQVKIGGRTRRVECASLILGYSRVQFAQIYPRWSRFLARVFLTDALQYLEGAASRCIVDNSSVIVASGTGPNAVMAAEMSAFAERFGFTFVAHVVGDADRSGKVERPFHYIENNFYPGRTFADFDDINAQLRTWCDRKRARHVRRLRASPDERFLIERPALVPLPLHVPEVYDVLFRRVDTEGFLNVHTNRYSVDEALIGRRLAIHEHHRVLRVFDGHELLGEYAKHEPGAGKRTTLPHHRQRRRRAPDPPLREEGVLRAAGPELNALVDALRAKHGGRAAKPMRRLHRIYLDYPTEVVVAAVAIALDHGLLDLGRIETIVLQQSAGDFFRLPTDDPEEGDDG